MCFVVKSNFFFLLQISFQKTFDKTLKTSQSGQVTITYTRATCAVHDEVKKSKDPEFQDDSVPSNSLSDDDDDDDELNDPNVMTCTEQ